MRCYVNPESSRTSAESEANGACAARLDRIFARRIFGRFGIYFLNERRMKLD